MWLKNTPDLPTKRAGKRVDSPAILCQYPITFVCGVIGVATVMFHDACLIDVGISGISGARNAIEANCPGDSALRQSVCRKPNSGATVSAKL